MNCVQAIPVVLGFVAALPLVSLLAGCGASHARYTPTSDEARSSLEAALTAWRDGKPTVRSKRRLRSRLPTRPGKRASSSSRSRSAKSKTTATGRSSSPSSSR